MVFLHLILASVVFLLSLSLAQAENRDDTSGPRPSRAKADHPTGLSQPKLSRRSFMRWFGAGAAAAATASPAKLLSSTAAHAKLPPQILREIAKIRVKTISIGEHGLPGLRIYMRHLQKIYARTNSQALREMLKWRIDMADSTLRNVDLIKLARREAIDASSPRSTNSSNETSHPRQSQSVTLEEQEASQAEVSEKLREMPVDLRIVTLRSLLPPPLLRKMAWQVHSVDESQDQYAAVLDGQELLLVKTYRNILGHLYQIEKSTGSEHLPALRQYLAEANAVIEAYHVSVPPPKTGNKGLPPLSLACQQIFL